MKIQFIYINLVLITALTSHCQNANIAIGKGTTILTYITKDTVWMAADTRVSFIGDYSIRNDTITKIWHYKNILFSIAGNDIMIDAVNGKEIFNGMEIMKKSLLQFEDIQNSFTNFKKNTISILSKNFKALLKSAQNKKIDPTHFLEITAVTFRNRIPYYIYSQCSIDTNTHQISFKDDTAAFKENNIIVMGRGEHIQTYIPILLNGTLSKKNALIELIRIECSKHPDKVAEPIDVAIIYQDKFKWLTDRKGLLK